MSAKQPASFRRKGLSTSKQRNKQQVGRWSHSWRHGRFASGALLERICVAMTVAISHDLNMAEASYRRVAD